MSEAKIEESELNALLCCEDCGKQFTRTKEYMRSPRSDVMFKWRTHKCDACVEARVNKALKVLPKVIDSLAT